MEPKVERSIEGTNDKESISTLSHCKFRCPDCLTLYEVSADKIRSFAPEFECPKCQCHFGFDYPPSNPNTILTYKVSPQQKQIQKSCPKCHHLQKESLQICESCGVVMENYLLIQQEAYPKVSVELIKSWQKIIQDYDNPEIHTQFINKCFKMNSIDYALFKYQELGKNIKNESSTESWISLINQRKEGLQKKVAKEQIEMQVLRNYKNIFKWSQLKQWMVWTPVLVASFLILFGFLSRSHRNSIGVGIFLMILSLGFIAFRRRD
ncbi:MAG: hypothetical protein HUU56_06765 [Bdellovibrionaceae bacterium]|nr:hypothetical protein [Pseudobdellovibrionaceae bacterium]